VKTTIKMPRVSDTVNTVGVVEIHVSAGDEVEQGHIVLTVDADKVTVDIPAPVSGTVTEVLVHVDDEISTGDPIMTLDT
jgi:pyruvate/2-oxoglutarate dehydrogenase complex dihydrolipoamide acyltransferase (E2) component